MSKFKYKPTNYEELCHGWRRKVFDLLVDKKTIELYNKNNLKNY